MRLLLPAPLVLLWLTGIWTAAASADADLQARARRILRAVPLVDGHNDLPWRLRQKVEGRLSRLDLAADTQAETLQTDFRRLRQGGVGAQFWSVYVEAEQAPAQAVAHVMQQIDLVRRMTGRYPQTLELALTAADIRRIHAQNRIACLIGIEGGHSMGNSLAVLRQLYVLGARAMTLTHGVNTDWADACSDEPVHGGLTAFGVEVVQEMNRLGMLVDLSHVSPQTMHAALDVSLAPVVFTHSSAYALVPHVRNVPDDVLQRLPDNGGLVMVTFVTRFVSQEVMDHDAEEAAEKGRLQVRFPGHKTKVKEHLEAWRAAHPRPHATVQQVADHILHVIGVAGIDHVGIGSDFDGISRGPTDLEDVSKFPNLLVQLMRRGLADADIEKITGRNALRVLRQAEDVARRLQTERGPSEALFETQAPCDQEP